MRTLALSIVALSACFTSPEVKPTPEVKEAPSEEESVLTKAELEARTSAILTRDKCDTERMAMPGVEGRAGVCFDDIVMFGIFTSCTEDQADFCSVEGLARMAAKEERANIEQTQIALPSGGELRAHRATGDDGETVFVVDEGLPAGVKLAVCGHRQPMFAARCAEIFDEMLNGTPRPPSGVLALRGALEEDCDVEDGPGWMAECHDDEVYVAAIVPPPGSPAPTIDGLLSSLTGGEVKVDVQAKKIDLANHKGAKVYVLDAMEKEKPIRVYVVVEGLTPEVKLFACAWRNQASHDPFCLALIDRALK